ncbi:alpha/beta hydrolase [Longimycelium tulufanense]|uniref:Alpha/beta hydrolase n=1 Tax=Longimycelium tulufanense TaxID=907463 RepID=A0A8J3FYA9_9PSEU|nr:alpha/beta hydrolase [Longimycelium tulufanense]
MQRVLGEAHDATVGVVWGGRRRVALVSALLAVPLLLTGGTLGGGWYYSTELLQPAQARVETFPDTVTEVRRGAEDVVVLSESPETRRKGTWGLRWEGGSARVGDIVRQGDGRVERKLLGGDPPRGERVRLDPDVWPGDPRSALGLDFQEVQVRTELGDMPAWLVPGQGDTWAITVHGRAGTRREALRIMPALHRLGLPVLAITYRNDRNAPPSPDGLYHLGAAEWRDLEAAVRTAQERGARHVVLVGWSMGGAIVGQFLGHSELAGLVDRVVLDAPVVSWRDTLDLQAGNRGLPSAFTPVAELVSGWRAGLDFDRFELAGHPPAHRPPMLLVHGSADSMVPVSSSRAFAEAAKRMGWPVRFVEFPDAEHTAEWNTDPQRYEEAVTAFLRG